MLGICAINGASVSAMTMRLVLILWIEQSNAEQFT